MTYIRLVGRLTKSKLHDYLHTNNRNNRLPRNYYSSRNDFTKDYVDKVVGNIDIKKIIDKNMRKDLKYSFKKMSDHPLTTEIEKIENNNEATLCTVNATITYKPIYINGQMYMLIKVYTKIINGEEVITYIVPIMYKVKVKTEDLLNGIILKWDSKFEEVITEYEQQQIIDKINELSEEGEMIVIDCDNGVIGDDVIEFKKNQTNDDFFDGIK